jgi:hypothetical protein
MKTFLPTAALKVASASAKVKVRDDQRAANPISQREIVTFQRIRKLPT